MSDVAKHNRRTPRKWWNLFWKLGGWSCLIPGVLFLILSIAGHSTEVLAGQFDREGAIAKATVIDRRIEESTDSDGDTDYTHYLTLEFVTNLGEIHRSEVSVGSGIYAEGQLGAEVELRYLPRAPGTLEVPVGSTASSSWWLVRISGVFGLAALVLFWIFAKKATFALKARRDGQKVTARITELRDTKFSVNNETRYRLIWEEESGEKGQSMMDKKSKIMTYAIGEKITVYRWKDQSWWEGDVGPRVRDMT